MSFVSVISTAIMTVPALVTATASLFGEPTTITTNVFTTIVGLPGQTLTIIPTLATDGTRQYTPFLAGSLLPPLYTVTVTEVDAFVQVADGSIWTRVFYDETDDSAAPTPMNWVQPYVPGEKILVLPALNSGWSSWSEGDRAGLCAGVVLLVLALGLLWWCCLHRRQEWIVQPRDTYWNGVYWGAGLRGGGGKWNLGRIALKWKKTNDARGQDAERFEGATDEPEVHGAGQTNPQHQGATALRTSQKQVMDGDRSNGGCDGVRRQKISFPAYQKNLIKRLASAGK